MVISSLPCPCLSDVGKGKCGCGRKRAAGQRRLFGAKKAKLPGLGQGTNLALGEWQSALCCVSATLEKESVAAAEGELPVNVDCLGQGRRLSYWVWGKERS
jgi:hypothetical protein